jgi:hypothetical protein
MDIVHSIAKRTNWAYRIPYNTMARHFWCGLFLSSDTTSYVLLVSAFSHFTVQYLQPTNRVVCCVHKTTTIRIC